MKTKTLDCVQMKRAGAAQIREQTAGMSPGQVVEFWRQRSAELRRQQVELRGTQDDGGGRAPTGPRSEP